MLAEAGGQATHLQLTKWAFLVRAETPWGQSEDGASFYQFVPYQFGPFSFGLFQEVACLTRDEFITELPNDRWQLTPAGAQQARRTPDSAAAAGRYVVKQFAKQPSDALIKYVYDRHPWFTINSRLRKLSDRPTAPLAIYTAGYEGLLIDGFLNGLLQHGITRLIDVRHNPIARRYGFHKSTLARLCGKLDIVYKHMPELGIPSDERQDLDVPGARTKLFAHYAATTLKTQDTAIQTVAQWMLEKPSVLVCMECKPCDCHRSHLAHVVAKLTGLPLRNLEIQR